VAGLRGPVLCQSGADPAWHGVGELRGGVRQVFFSEEKKQKTFDLWGGCSPDPTRQMAKVFWFFFSKKNSLFPSYNKPLHRTPQPDTGPLRYGLRRRNE
jgi:hypothetical protein